jgi:RNA-binding protein
MLSNPQIRELKARAQKLKPTLKIGKEGVSPGFLQALDDALKHNELLKIKFDDFKAEKKSLSPQIAEKTGSRIIMRVGNVLVLYRPKPEEPDSIRPPEEESSIDLNAD